MTTAKIVDGGRGRAVPLGQLRAGQRFRVVDAPWLVATLASKSSCAATIEAGDGERTKTIRFYDHKQEREVEKEITFRGERQIISLATEVELVD